MSRDKPENYQKGAHFGKFVAYYRVSTDKQGQSGLGLDAQRQAVMTYLNGESGQAGFTPPFRVSFTPPKAGPSSPSKFYGAGRWMPNLFSTAAPWSLPGTSTKGSWFILWLTRPGAGIC